MHIQHKTERLCCFSLCLQALFTVLSAVVKDSKTRPHNLVHDAEGQMVHLAVQRLSVGVTNKMELFGIQQEPGQSLAAAVAQ